MKRSSVGIGSGARIRRTRKLSFKTNFCQVAGNRCEAARFRAEAESRLRPKCRSPIPVWRERFPQMAAATPLSTQQAGFVRKHLFVALPDCPRSCSTVAKPVNNCKFHVETVSVDPTPIRGKSFRNSRLFDSAGLLLTAKRLDGHSAARE